MPLIVAATRRETARRGCAGMETRTANYKKAKYLSVLIATDATLVGNASE